MKKRWIMTLSLISLIMVACSIESEGGAKDMKIVYIKEYDEYIPYYLLSENYDQKYLLLRVDNLPDKMCYCSKNTYGSISGYYAESDLDTYLTNEFKKRFSDDFLTVIGETSIKIAKKDDVWKGTIPAQTESIQRQFFVLSATEMGLKSGMMAKEGTKQAAIKGIEEKEVQWLRSAYLADDVSAWVWGSGHYGGESVASLQCVRPAFTLEKSVTFEESTEVIKDKSVLIPVINVIK